MRTGADRMDVEIALDHYGDVFSDFDVRSYRERVISLDFLRELRVRLGEIHHCPQPLRIVLSLPRERREAEVEKVVAKRLKEIFRGRAEAYRRKMARAVKEGLLLVGGGVAVLFLSVSLSFTYPNQFLPTLLSEFLFLPSWFFTWSGLERIVEAFTSLRRKRDFYLCLSRAKVLFRDEPE